MRYIGWGKALADLRWQVCAEVDGAGASPISEIVAGIKKTKTKKLHSGLGERRDLYVIIV